MNTLLFDYDGTLHDSLRIYAPAFRKAMQYLEEKGQKPHEEYTDADIAYWLGFNVKDMWSTYMPTLSEEEVETCSQLIGAEMLRLAEDGQAKLYDGVVEVLQELRARGCHLILLSNCKKAYMEVHKRLFSLEKYFSAFYCSEDYGFIPKYEIFESIQKKYEGSFLVIGDRYQDMEIAIKHGLPSIGCTYGYGSREELQWATKKIDDIQELLTNEYVTKLYPGASY